MELLEIDHSVAIVDENRIQKRMPHFNRNNVVFRFSMYFTKRGEFF